MPGRTQEAYIGDLPIRLPVIDIHTVGAGGGSIARRDEGGSLRVGPRSAGAAAASGGRSPAVADPPSASIKSVFTSATSVSAWRKETV